MKLHKEGVSAGSSSLAPRLALSIGRFKRWLMHEHESRKSNIIALSVASAPPSPVPFPYDTVSVPRSQFKKRLVNSYFFVALAQSSIAIDSPRFFPLPLMMMESRLAYESTPSPNVREPFCHSFDISLPDQQAGIFIREAAHSVLRYT